MGRRSTRKLFLMAADALGETPNTERYELYESREICSMHCWNTFRMDTSYAQMASSVASAFRYRLCAKGCNIAHEHGRVQRRVTRVWPPPRTRAFPPLSPSLVLPCNPFSILIIKYQHCCPSNACLAMGRPNQIIKLERYRRQCISWQASESGLALGPASLPIPNPFHLVTSHVG